MKTTMTTLPRKMAELRRWVARIRGICLTTTMSGHERRTRGSAGRREPCLVAYAGEGRGYRSQRFRVRPLGIPGAAARAMRWRRRHACVALTSRTCDRARRRRHA